MLTSAQQATLASAIAADSTLSAQAGRNEFPSIADAMNAAASPAATLWLRDMLPSLILASIAVADMPTPAASLAFLKMMLSVPTVDASVPAIRANFGVLFSGKTSLTTLTAAAQRPATRFEMLFATAAAPSNTSTVYGALLTADDVRLALGK